MWAPHISLDTMQVGRGSEGLDYRENVSRSAGSVGSNILFDGSSTMCQIKIISVKNEESGDWICRFIVFSSLLMNFISARYFSLEKDGYRVNSSSVQLTEAMPATVDWLDVYGSMEVRSEGIHINNGYSRPKLVIAEPAPKITCAAAHSRPAGRFLWFLGEVRYFEIINFDKL